jgi:hypothetical protein
MKLRAGVSALLLSFALPAVVTEVGLPCFPLAEPQAFAQASDPVTEVARQRYEDGVKAYDAGRYEDARTAFLQAYALKRHPAVLLNLGQSELRSNHPEDAGNHLNQFLREHKAATPDQKAAAEKGLTEAKKKAGFIIVIVDANGADVSIDGTLIGKSPLLDPVFVKPGKHTVFASHQGKSSTTQIDAKAGSAAAANLTLGVPGSAPAPAPMAPIPAPAPAAPAAPAGMPPGPGPAAAPPGPPPGPPPGYPAAEPSGFNMSASGGFDATGPDQASGGREPILHWYLRKPIAWAATGVFGLGLIGSITFWSLAAGSSGSADNVAQTINEYAAANPSTTQGRSSGYCGPREDPSGDLPGYENACNELRDKLDTYDTQLTVGWVFFGVGLVGAAGLATYAMIDWYPNKNWDSTKQGALPRPRITAIAPVVGPGQGGLGIAGTF